MAKILLPAFGKASGKFYGGVLAHSRGTNILKKYTIPTIQNTPAQQIKNTKFSYLQQYWEKNLTFAQCELWRTYSLTRYDAWGNILTFSGINKFFALNSILYDAGKTLTLIPPTLTPSAITEEFSNLDIQYRMSITEVSAEEATAQETFYQVKVNSVLTSDQTSAGESVFYTDGKSVTRKTLEREYIAYPFINNSWVAWESDAWTLKINPNLTTPKLFSISITRYNKFGMWSNTKYGIGVLTAE